MKLVFAVLLVLVWPVGPAVAAQSTIPFVGCIEAGPTVDDGSWTAPSGQPLVTSLAPAVATKLAVYASNWSAVLAPRGWACRSTVNALKGVAMIVAPEAAIDSGTGIFSGPAVMAWNDGSDATVAAYKGRYFAGPGAGGAMWTACGAHCAGALVPLYPGDKIRYRGALVLDFVTPAHRMGLGSLGGGVLPALPSYGVLALSDLPRGAGGIVNLTVRLPPDLAGLHGAIVDAFRKCLPDRNTVACESGGAFVAQGHPVDDGD